MSADGSSDFFQELFKLMEKLDDHFFISFGSKVLSGPFAGMIVSKTVVWSDGNVTCKLLGLYERELHEAIEKAISRQPSTIIDIGCAEGYYAVGLARRLQESKVYAFDIDEKSLGLCAVNAGKNQIDFNRFTFALGCRTPEEVAAIPVDSGRCLIVMDCEGYEMVLVDPEKCPLIKRSDLIIECHDFMNPGCSEHLRKLLSATHDVTVIKQEFPVLQGGLLDQHIAVHILAVTDKRPNGCGWMVAWCKE